MKTVSTVTPNSNVQVHKETGTAILNLTADEAISLIAWLMEDHHFERVTLHHPDTTGVVVEDCNGNRISE